MIGIDRYAYASKFKRTDPMQKFTFAIITLGVCLWADLPIISVCVFIIMSWVTVCKGGTPLPFFIKLLLLPMSFLIIGVLSIAVNVSKNSDIFLIFIPIDSFYIGVSKYGLFQASQLFLKVMGSVACLYFLSLSTPMIDLLSVLSKLKVPKLVVEIMGLIYRFVFILIEAADTMYTAQKSRLGYENIASAYRSLGALASQLFIRAYKRADELYTALEARGYDGELNVLEETLDKSRKMYIAAIIINTILILTSLYLKQFTGGLF